MTKDELRHLFEKKAVRGAHGMVSTVTVSLADVLNVLDNLTPVIRRGEACPRCKRMSNHEHSCGYGYAYTQDRQYGNETQA